MKRKIIICAVVATVIGLVLAGVCTGVLPGGVLPFLKKAAKAVPPRLWAGLLFKLLILTGLMGFVTKKFNERRERFVNGENENKLNNNYSLVVGYDFQTRPLIKRLLQHAKVDMGTGSNGFFSRLLIGIRRFLIEVKYKIFADDRYRVLVITDHDVRAIRAEMAKELTKEEGKRVLYMRRDLAMADTYSGLRVRGAQSIFIMGDEGVPGRDGIVLRASDAIAEKVKKEKMLDEKSKPDNKSGKESADKQSRPIKVYLQFEDPAFYSRMRDSQLPMDPEVKEVIDEKGKKKEIIVPDTVLFDLEVFNYYDSWVWKCWSEKDSTDGEDRYLPIRFKSNAERVELFVIGSGKAAKAVIDSAIMLMNYGADSKNCRLTVVSDRAFEILPPEDAIAALPELEVVDCPMRDLHGKVSSLMVEAADDEKCAVTVVIVEDASEKVTRTYLGLPFALRSRDVSVLMWMGSQSRNIPQKRLIKVAGDRTRLRYFGVLDCMPWLESDRQQMGVAVNYYYSDCYGDRRLPKGIDCSLLPAAKELWDEEKACSEWSAEKRWAKWSSISSAGCFKEKMSIISGRAMTSELQLKLLKAEHNRWWSERLLAEWKLCAKPMDADEGIRKKKEKELKSLRQHWDLVPFDRLDDFTKDIDKLCIAAMAQQGFIAAT